MLNPNNVPELGMPGFEHSGKYDGKIPAARWLLRLKFDFRRGGHNSPSRELYLEIVEILSDGLAADRLACTPRIRRIMKNRATATDQQLLKVDEWLQEEFPDNLKEGTE